jgi:hypothetical protein
VPPAAAARCACGRRRPTKPIPHRRALLASEAASRKPVVKDKEIDRGGGVLEQVSSGLLWTQRDNGADITRDSARKYCDQLSISGKGWRLPSERDLQTLFLDAVGTKACGAGFCGVPSGFSLTSFQIWTGDTDDSGKGRFVNFEQGMSGAAPSGYSYRSRALCVRNP